MLRLGFDFVVDVDTRLDFIEHVVVVAGGGGGVGVVVVVAVAVVAVVVLDVEFISDAMSWRSCSCC